MLAMFGTGEIIVILAVVLLLFGAKKLPELARSLGSGVREFKQALGTDPITPPKENKEGESLPPHE